MLLALLSGDGIGALVCLELVGEEVLLQVDPETRVHNFAEAGTLP